MEGVGLTLLGLVLFAGVASFRWRQRKRRLPVVARSVRCPLHDGQAHITVRRDPHAPARERYVEVTRCSLQSDLAVALPAHTEYLPDSPPYQVVLETATTHPVFAPGVSCSQRCVSVLNAATPAVTPQPLACSSGVSDAIELMRQAGAPTKGSRLSWYAGV